MRKFKQIIAAGIFLAATFINVKQDENGSILLFGSLLAETSPFGTITGTGTGTGTGTDTKAPGSCFRTVEVMCSKTETTTTKEPTKVKESGQWGVTGSGTASGSGNGASVGVSYTAGNTTTTPGSSSSSTTTKYRADCEGGGDSGCQPSDCEGKSVGSYKECK